MAAASSPKNTVTTGYDSRQAMADALSPKNAIRVAHKLIR